ncbi:hypothetical protein [Bacillus sp. 7884-1]|uniref:hypothetical protein n=1 Tax=Bacillus sp. 7884-1 TaxID=2021693 RepID=UPI0015CBA17C|nr:hypothetical protein [Bacillus sp. 7884-1]
MFRKLFYSLIALFLFTITGCSNVWETTKVTIESIDAEEVLTLDPDADIFVCSNPE